MSEFSMQVVPAPPYNDTRYLCSSVQPSVKKCNICNANEETDFRINQNIAHSTSVVNCETCRLRFLMRENIGQPKTNHSWRTISKHNVTLNENNPESFNEFDNNTSNSSTENNASFNLISSTFNNVFPSQNIETQHHYSVNASPNNLTVNNTGFINNSPVHKGTCFKSDAVVILNIQGTCEVASVETNEFSDHSDSESFTRLSESVFEAIEDTQDSVIENQDTIEETTSQAREETRKKSKHRPRTCHICGKSYKASSSYFYHMKHFHRRTKEHSCDVCYKKFGTRGDLIQHSAVHSIECKFECRICEKKFRSRASRYIHEQIHGGVKSYKCPRCDKCFRWRTHLQRHLLRHAAEKKHECTVCGRGFSVRCDLLRHARTHNVGNYQCDKCDVKFAQIRYLKAHMAKKHNITSKDTG